MNPEMTQQAQSEEIYNLEKSFQCSLEFITCKTAFTVSAKFGAQEKL